MIRETKWLIAENMIISLDMVLSICKFNNEIIISLAGGEMHNDTNMTFTYETEMEADSEFKMIIFCLRDHHQVISLEGKYEFK